MKWLLANWEALVLALGILAVAVVLGLILHFILFTAMGRVARRTQAIFDDSFVKHLRRPLQLLVPLLVVSFVLSALTISPRILAVLKQLLSLGIITSVAWLVVRTTNVLDDVVLNRYRIDERDNLQARKIYTQLQVFKRIVVVVVSILALATMLLTFDKVLPNALLARFWPGCKSQSLSLSGSMMW